MALMGAHSRDLGKLVAGGAESPQSAVHSSQSTVQGPWSQVPGLESAAGGRQCRVGNYGHDTLFVSEARLARLTLPEWVIVAVRRMFGHRRRAGGSIIPLYYMESRTAFLPFGEAIFSSVCACG